MRLLKAINELALYWRLNINVTFYDGGLLSSTVCIYTYCANGKIGVNLAFSFDERFFLHRLDDACRQVTAGYINHILKDWKSC